MSLVYILVEGEEQRTYEEAELRALMPQGTFPAGTLYWKEGVEEWRPLEEFPVSQAQSFVPPRRMAGGAAPQTTSVSAGNFPVAKPSEVSASAMGGEDSSRLLKKRRSRYRFRTNPVPLTICLLLLFMAALIMNAVTIYQCCDKIFGWSAASGGTVETEAQAMLNVNAGPVKGISKTELYALFLILVVGMGLHLLAEILFYFWIYYTSRNTRAFVSNLKYTPGWAVGCFFIPFVNLFMPYLVMQEIWKANANPVSWNGRRDSIFVGLWFFVRLSVVILGRGVFRTSYSESDDPAIQAIGVAIYMATAVGIIFLMDMMTAVLVSTITWRQVRLTRKG